VRLTWSGFGATATGRSWSAGPGASVRPACPPAGRSTRVLGRVRLRRMEVSASDEVN
jgi:hypothetical protein